MSKLTERLAGLDFSRLKHDYSDQNAFILTFDFDGFVVVTIRITLDDRQSGAKLLITNITTFPETIRGKGYGTKAVQSLLVWAHTSGLDNIQATQVQTSSEGFWIKNHFMGIGNAVNDFRYLPKP